MCKPNIMDLVNYTLSCYLNGLNDLICLVYVLKVKV